ncbi:uncharacterized protein F4822DRAFT_390052 [Hypoxylon trugodes]|uniref:uncharacterized protein n=1 Tax=Hypoxylon trugodes TaxID=326681 RepID=UPI00218D75E4|nr:uncharacterized protein F4822DRAFT_390052 [Hypoxylon trugodes]KAI1392212.1 hypothetical protein F4822DRAFT_390052 [Hypoxylon trugodes]
MPPEEFLTDDQVANLLVKEAQDCSLRYSAMGLDAFKSSKRPANQPKPNTRFLNNIIRDTNSHNRALLAKENAESQAKLRDLEDAEEKKRKEEGRKLRKSKPGPSDTRKRMLGDIAAILGSSKRRRTERTDIPTGYASDLPEPSSSDRNKHRQRKSFAASDTTNKRASSRKDRSTGRSDVKAQRYTYRCEDSSGGGSLSTDPRGRKRRRHSPRSDRDRQLGVVKHSESRPSQSESEESSDSDPLEEIIGPLPARKTTVQRRGRGANASTSGIDSRFAPDYDPRNDVTPDPEEGDDWERAAEAFRDRQKWKLQRADRLRSAGFTEEQIKKWETGDEKDEADVRWTKAGGLREWDRGKVVAKDGTVTLATGDD